MRERPDGSRVDSCTHVPEPSTGAGLPDAPPAAQHRWSGWPGAWCLDCGCDDPQEVFLANDRFMILLYGTLAFKSEEDEQEFNRLNTCPEPGSNRHNPYVLPTEGTDMTPSPAPVELGKASAIPTDPDAYVIDCVPNPNPEAFYIARFTIPEFTSLCPVTGQPDFAHIVIDYAPADKLIESKSLKLFMFSFRNHGDFHEACTLKIAHKLIKAAAPQWFRIGAFWYPRGGIPIDVFYEQGDLSSGQRLILPDVNVPTYRGRG
jgi:7-cyano-7-deazaguanine reductase